MVNLAEVLSRVAERGGDPAEAAAGPRKAEGSKPITLNRYGHLMPGSEVEARAMLNTYLDKRGTRGRTISASTGREA